MKHSETCVFGSKHSEPCVVRSKHSEPCVVRSKHSEPCVLGSTRDFDLTHSRVVQIPKFQLFTCQEVVGVQLPPLQHFVTHTYSRVIDKIAQDVTKLN